MNISYNWLKEYVDFDLQPVEVAEALTSIGLEVGGVEEIEAVRGGLKGLCVGHVLTCEAHPNSDHMHVCTVELGEGRVEQIVCGAPNVAAGQKVIVATIGTQLYSPEGECFTIKRSKLRGVESMGMICAEDEIGVGQSHEGIMVLPEDTPVGMPASEYFQLESDWLIEVDITPNRADACSHYGVARDLYAYLRRQGQTTSLHRPDVDKFIVDNHDLDIDVKVENAEACPRYCAVSIKGCNVSESPEWLQRRLTAIGLRPINNIVDITNYIMMAYGQPLHCFDADMIKGGQIVVKTMPEGTPFVTLDGTEHKLSEHDLAICNAEEPMCIAGVFGGQGSGTYGTTRNVVLESAYFHPTWIRKSARRHGLSTDASFRFERGIDPDGQIYALKRAAMLVKELAGGEVAMEIKDVQFGDLVKEFPVEITYTAVDRLIGKHIPEDLVKLIVSSLEMRIVKDTAEGLSLMVPGYRVDVQRPCDVVEDILRIYGYNNVEIPSSVKSSLNIKGEVDRSNKLANLVSEQLVGAGFREILNNSLTREAYYTELKSYPSTGLVRLMNPLSSDLGVLRSSLLFGGLEVIAHNANRKMANLRLFEWGNCYHFDGTKESTAERPLTPYSEEFHMGMWLCGNRVEGSWAHPDEESSVYELKANVMNVLRRIGLPIRGMVVSDGHNDIFAKSLSIADRNGKVMVELGLVSRCLTAQCDISMPVYYADFNWTALMKKVGKAAVSFQEICKFPPVSRDLALLVDKNVAFADIERIAYACGKKYLKRVELFDVYEGKNLEEGKKSYAVNFQLQDEQKTMSDKQTDAIMKNIIAQLEKEVGAKLR